MHIPQLAKQIMGAVAGATVAMVIYEAYLLLGPSLTALVTMPTAPGVDQQDEVRLATKEVQYNQERRERRQKELAERFGNGAIGADSASSSSVEKWSTREITSDPENRAEADWNSSASAEYDVIGQEQEASSSSVWVPMQEEQPGFEPVPIGAGSPSGEPTVHTQAITEYADDRLPNSGFGLGLIAVAAVGAVIGRRKARQM